MFGCRSPLHNTGADMGDKPQARQGVVFRDTQEPEVKQERRPLDVVPVIQKKPEEKGRHFDLLPKKPAKVERINGGGPELIEKGGGGVKIIKLPSKDRPHVEPIQ